MKWTRILVLMVLLLGAWWIWSRVFVSDQTRLRLQLVAMTRAVEQGNLLRLEDAITDDYKDDLGADKSMLLGGVRGYRQQYDGLFIHLSDVTVTIGPKNDSAEAVFVAKVLAKPKGGGGETQLVSDRFRLSFRRTDQGWKLYRSQSPQLKFD